MPTSTQQAALEVVVLVNSLKGTQEPLAKAAAWAADLGAWVTLLVPLVVPYPLPLEEPPVSVKFLRREFETLARAQRLTTRVLIGLCRDGEQFIEANLGECSTIMLERGRRRLKRRLSAQGHKVITI
jgi:hypothetical protein